MYSHFCCVGVCQVSTQEDRELANWVELQRECYNENILPSERVILLNSIGFCFARAPKVLQLQKRTIAEASASVTNHELDTVAPSSNKKLCTANSPPMISLVMDEGDRTSLLH